MILEAYSLDPDGLLLQLFVYIDILGLDESDLLTWQLRLMPDELTRMGIRPNAAQDPVGVLQPTTPAKRAILDPSPPSPKRQRTEPVELTTDGLDAAAVTRILLAAVGKYPETREIVEMHRPTILEGLSEDSSRKALLAIAQIHDDVLREVGSVREQQNAQVERFEATVASSIRLLHSLDRLRPSQQYERSYEVSCHG